MLKLSQLKNKPVKTILQFLIYYCIKLIFTEGLYCLQYQIYKEKETKNPSPLHCKRSISKEISIIQHDRFTGKVTTRMIRKGSPSISFLISNLKLKKNLLDSNSIFLASIILFFTPFLTPYVQSHPLILLGNFLGNLSDPSCNT